MAKQFPSLTEDQTAFIRDQHVFFSGTAAAEGRVNVSPKGMDSLRVAGPNRRRIASRRKSKMRSSVRSTKSAWASQPNGPNGSAYSTRSCIRVALPWSSRTRLPATPMIRA